MPATRIALIEGNKKETEFIQSHIFSEFEGVDYDLFQSISEFRNESAQSNNYDIIISDLLEGYAGEPREETIEKLASSSRRLLDSPYENKNCEVIFLTKVPISYIGDAIQKEIDRFPVAEHKLSLTGAGVYNFDEGYISIIEKPYETADDDSVIFDKEDDGNNLTRIISEIRSMVNR